VHSRSGDYDALCRAKLTSAWNSGESYLCLNGAEHEMRRRILRSLPVRSRVYLQRWPSLQLRPVGTVASNLESLMARKPKLAVWKFASCDGCQLSVLSCEDELLALADNLTIAYFPEASSALIKGPYDLSLVEGSITTPRDAERIHEIRAASRSLVTLGACA